MDEKFVAGTVAGKKIGTARAYGLIQKLIKENPDIGVDIILNSLLELYNKQ